MEPEEPAHKGDASGLPFWPRDRRDSDAILSATDEKTNDRRRGDRHLLGEQDYTLEGNAQHVSAPMTTVLHRRGDGWKMVLFHSIPLPEDEAQ